MKTFLTLVVFLTLPLFSFAQAAFQVSGTLTDINGLPIANNEVEIWGSTFAPACIDSIFIHTETDNNGYYDATVESFCDTGTVWIVPSNCDIPFNFSDWGTNTTSITLDATCGNICQILIDIAVDSTMVPTTFTATATGGTPPYTYYWSDGNIGPLIGVIFPDEYCVTVTDSDGCDGAICLDHLGNSGPCIDPNLIDPDAACTTDFDPVCGCDGVAYSNSCIAENFYGVTSWIPGGCQGNCQVQIEVLPVVNTTEAFLLKTTAFGVAPFTYQWSTGEISADITVDQTGSYCVTVTDADGCNTDQCEWVNIIITNPCLDASQINLDICTTLYNPVCGCDGVTYTNQCVAQYFYGIQEWEDGPCDIDTLSNCYAELLYTINEENDSLVTIDFNADGPDNLFYYWEFSDGSVSSEANPFLVFLQDENAFNFTACLTAYDAAQCTTRVCETIVVMPDGDGLIDGHISSADGLTDEDSHASIVRSSAGDPLPDVSVLLLDINLNIVEESITNTNGYYRFDNLFFGDYYVQVNIDGIPHEPFHVNLLPQEPTSSNLDFNVTDDMVLSNENLLRQTNFEVFPNPTKAAMTLQFDLQEQSDLEISISNILGQEIQKYNYSLGAGAQAIQLNTNDLVPNIYLLQIRHGAEIFTKKIIKQ